MADLSINNNSVDFTIIDPTENSEENLNSSEKKTTKAKKTPSKTTAKTSSKKASTKAEKEDSAEVSQDGWVDSRLSMDDIAPVQSDIASKEDTKPESSSVAKLEDIPVKFDAKPVETMVNSSQINFGDVSNMDRKPNYMNRKSGFTPSGNRVGFGNNTNKFNNGKPAVNNSPLNNNVMGNVNNLSNKDKDKTSETMSVNELEEKTLVELRAIATKLHISQVESYKKAELIMKIVEEQVKSGGNIFASGFLEIINDGAHGILRSRTMVANESDVYISSSQIKRFNLRKGDFVSGQGRSAKEGERYLSLLKVEAINGLDPEKSLLRPTFERLTPIYPNEQIKLETGQFPLANRIIDMISPIGKGQRGMISAPPKSGKTILLKDVALGIRKNSPEIHLMIVLIGERPEEVTDIERTVPGAEVFASNFDESPQDQTKVAEMALERAKRLVEKGLDVVILMDSITRLARAYNVALPTSGRTLSGGMDPAALYPAKRFFGAARNFEIGGSLTIIATALVETGSRMDDVVFEEFKGTGNMELKLDRDLAESKVYPAIDIFASSTRNEELLLGSEVLEKTNRLNRMLRLLRDNKQDPTSVLVDRLKKSSSNADFLDRLMEG